MQQKGRVQQLVKAFENMRLLPEIQKIEIKSAHKAFYKRANTKHGKLGQENLKSNGSVERWAISGMDQPLAERQPNNLSDKNCGSFASHCNMFKHEDGGSSVLSDTQNLQSAMSSESSSQSRCSSQSRRGSEKSFDSTERGSPTWKSWAEQQKKQVRVTPIKPFRLLTEQRGQVKEQQFIRKIQQKIDKEEKCRIPVAQGLPLTTDKPQVLPKPPVKEHTKPFNVKLCTESRAVERAKFDNLMEEKFYSLQQQRLEEERLQKLAEEEEIKRLRKEMIPYAQLMPFFDRPFVPKKSSKSPTIPREPKFHRYHHHIECLS